jgi:hypothetical protein
MVQKNIVAPTDQVKEKTNTVKKEICVMKKIRIQLKIMVQRNLKNIST